MTLEEIKANLKLEYPTLRTGSDEVGYTEMTDAQYEETINEWAKNLYAEELKKQAEAEAQAKREAALAKLEALGLDEDDLKALGL